MATLHRAGAGLVFVYSTPALTPRWLYVTALHRWARWFATATVEVYFTVKVVFISSVSHLGSIKCALILSSF